MPRERLVRRLLEAREASVALLVAPAGYGKTTLLSEWASNDDRPFAWLTLEASDNDPTTLLSAIALALDAVEPIGWEVFEALSSKRSDAPTIALQRLARALGKREVECVLALDDVHVLSAPAVLRSVLAIGRALPSGSELALAGRSDSALPVGRLRAQGGSLELRTEDLAMTRSEASSLLRQAGLRLMPDEVLALTSRTEGWPAGLYLAALSLREQTGPRLEVREFAGDDRFVSEYVREEFLSELTADELDFLTRSSVLRHLSGSLCDAVLARRGSADMLAGLARDNSMLVPLDRSGTSYRHHELLGCVLRSELLRREPGRTADLHRLASEWCEANGDGEGAIDHAVEAHDAQRAGRLLLGSALRGAGRGSVAALRASLGRFSDEELSRDPMLALASAASCLLVGDLYEAGRWTSLAAGAPAGPLIVEGGVASMRAALGSQGVAQMGSHAGRALGVLEVDDPWHPLALFFAGVAYHLTGDRGRAEELLQEGAHRARLLAPVFGALCLAQSALLADEQEDSERAIALAVRATAQVERCGLSRCPVAALVFAVSAALRAERGQADKASGDARKALDLLSEITDPAPWYAGECSIMLARAALRANGLPLAREQLASAAQALDRTPDARVLAEWLATAQADLDLALECTADTDWSLTNAELRVLRYLPSHLSFGEIAARLFVSHNTVKTHARGIYRKLGVSCRGSAVDRARDAGLVDPVAGGA